MDNRVRKGIPMSKEELEDYRKAFADIEESIELVYKYGVEL